MADTAGPFDADRYRLRVSLVGSEPEIWRLLDVSAAMALSDLHAALQIAFGWRQSHSHLFTAADPSQGRDEEETTVGDVLTADSGPLLYGYDGDSWEHLVELVESRPGSGDTVAQLVAGERRGPLEDSGGVDGYAELVAAWSDPDDPRHSSARSWAAATAGPWAAAFDPTRLEVRPLSRGLTDRFDPTARRSWGEVLPALVDRLFPGLRAEFVGYLDGAELGHPVAPRPADAEAATAPYRWLLSRVGAAGIKLTGSGWLPGEVVTEAAAGLGWATRWAEDPEEVDEAVRMMSFRQSAVRVGLLRKQQGSLHLTATGQELAADPVALWGHIARRWLPSKRTGIEQDAAILLAVELAVGAHPGVAELLNSVAYGLDALGWVNATDRGSVSADDARSLVEADLALWGDLGWLGDPTAARAVLTPGRAERSELSQRAASPIR